MVLTSSIQFGSVFRSTDTFYVVPTGTEEVDDGSVPEVSGMPTETIYDWAQPIAAKFLYINGSPISDAYPNGSQGNALYEISTYNPNSLIANGTQNSSRTISGGTAGGANPNDNLSNYLVVPVNFDLNTFVNLAASYKQEWTKIK